VGEPPGADVLAAVAAETLGPAQAGPGVAVHVRDLGSGAELFSQGGDVPHVPASTLKILTAIAALETLGPDTTLETNVFLAPEPNAAGAWPVTLVGGGDVLLGHGEGDPNAVNGRAGLTDLARGTAEALGKDNVRAIELRLDDTLFTGEALREDWKVNGGTSYVAAIQALEVDVGRAGTGPFAPRLPDPAGAAAQEFAAQLGQAAKDAGISLTISEALRAPVGERDVLLAQVVSAPVRELVEYQLQESENTLSESLGRLVSIARGGEGTFAGAASAVTAVAGELGVPMEGVTLLDASGLSHSSVIPPATLTAALALVSGGGVDADLAGVVRGLPIAGLEGTLGGRMQTLPTLGNVRAKTGSLDGVASLAGTVQTASGNLLAFAVIADQSLGVGPSNSRNALDEFCRRLAQL
jgi:D-alanyl-D-alanine carboxypeptidase/D-alanyl-D-alanine-endopeptidase (penicillin-binding protein 4)